jgi:hypothetical protein
MSHCAVCEGRKHGGRRKGREERKEKKKGRKKWGNFLDLEISIKKHKK